MKYIVNGSVILKDRIVEDHVLAFDNKICGITTNDEIPADAEIIDTRVAT